MDKQELLTSLYEISLSIGATLELDRLLDDSISTYMRQLNCSGALVIHNQENTLKYIYFKPKIISKNQKLLSDIENFIIDGCKTCNSKGFRTFEYDGHYVYMSRLENFGFLVLIKNDNNFEEYLLHSLNGINDKLANAILACLNNQRLRLNENTMYQQSKMASMGEMMSNIAHQWRQPLQVISITTQKLQLTKMVNGEVSDEEIDEMVTNVSSQLDYLTQTIEDFRSFFRPDKEKRNFILNQCVEKTISLVSASLNQNSVKLQLNNYAKDLTVFSLENELKQVFVNIIITPPRKYVNFSRIFAIIFFRKN